MNGFLKTLFSSLHGIRSNTELDAVIERAAQTIEPKLKLTSGYPRRYRKSIACALAYSRELAQQVPGPFTLDREAYTKQPFVRAAFASAEEIQSVLDTSHDMQEYIKHNSCPVGCTLYAVLGMRRREKNVLGMEISGDTVRREVAQTAVSFSSHTLSNIARSETDVRDMLTWSFMDSLLGRVAEQIEQLKQDKLEVNRRYGEITVRLHAADATQRGALQHELETTLAELTVATGKLDLNHYAECIDAVLLQPQAHLRLELTTLCLDDMGIKREPGNGREIVCFDLAGRDRRRWCLALLHCQSPSLIPMSERLEQASRWMNI